MSDHPTTHQPNFEPGLDLGAERNTPTGGPRLETNCGMKFNMGSMHPTRLNMALNAIHAYQYTNYDIHSVGRGRTIHWGLMKSEVSPLELNNKIVAFVTK